MLLRRLCLLGIAALAPVVSLYGQPDAAEKLETLVEHFEAAGNYTWEETSAFDNRSGNPPPRNPPSMGSGKTDVDGFTLATIQRREIVFYNGKAALKVNGLWRKAEDLTDSEIFDAGFFGAGSKSTANRARAYKRALAHEILPLLLKYGINIRRDGATLVGEFDHARIHPMLLENYIVRGEDIPVPVVRSSLGMPAPVGRPLPKTMPSLPSDGTQAHFVLWFSGNTIEEFAVEFRKPRVLLNGPNAGEEEFTTRTYTNKLRDIGRTRVMVDREVRDLFTGGR